MIAQKLIPERIHYVSFEATYQLHTALAQQFKPRTLIEQASKRFTCDVRPFDVRWRDGKSGVVPAERAADMLAPLFRQHREFRPREKPLLRTAVEPHVCAQNAQTWGTRNIE